MNISDEIKGCQEKHDIMFNLDREPLFSGQPMMLEDLHHDEHKRLDIENLSILSIEQVRDSLTYVERLLSTLQAIVDEAHDMTEEIEKFYKALFEEDKWAIHYLKHKDSMIAGAFVYESEKVDYLYNSCRDHNLDEFNTGTYLNDQLLQNSIKKSKQYFDFLKGEEKYKFNFGGEVHQLYDLKIKV